MPAPVFWVGAVLLVGGAWFTLAENDSAGGRALISLGVSLWACWSAGAAVAALG